MHIHTIQINIEKLIGGTIGMDATEFGAYMSLIVSCYQANNKILASDDRLARMARVSPKVWKRIKPTISQKFTESDGYWSNNGVQKELQRCLLLSTKNKANALRNKETSKPVASQSRSQTIANTSNKEQVTKNKEQDKIDIRHLDDAVSAYNEIGLPKVQKLSTTRKAKLTARLKDCNGLNGWLACLDKVTASDFLMGRTKSWRAGFDFIVTEDKFIKIMEGAYDNTKTQTKNDNIQRQTQELIENGW